MFPQYQPLFPVFALHYALMAAVVILAFGVLRSYRGASVLAFLTLSIVVSNGIVLALLPNHMADVRALAPDAVQMARMTWSLIIFYSVCGAFLLVEWLLRPQHAAQERMEIPRPFIPSGLILFILPLAAVFLVVRFRAPDTWLVLKEGIKSSGSFLYYDLRKQMGDVRLANFPRWERTLYDNSRAIFFIVFLTATYKWARYRSRSTRWISLMMFGVLLVDAFLTYQKYPVVNLVVFFVLPFALFRGKSVFRGGKLKYGRAALFGLLVLFVMVSVFVVTQGLDWQEGVYHVFERSLFISSEASMFHFMAFPDILSFRYYGYVRAIAAVTGISTSNFFGSLERDVAYAIMDMVYGSNACLVAESWANGGYPVVAMVCLVVGFFLLIVDLYVKTQRMRADLTPLVLFYASLIPAFGNASFLSFIPAYGLWFIPFVYPYMFGKSQAARTRHRTEAMHRAKAPAPDLAPERAS